MGVGGSTGDSDNGEQSNLGQINKFGGQNPGEVAVKVESAIFKITQDNPH